MEIRKILQRTDGIKYLIIPKKSDLKKGDYVMIIKINQKEVIENKETETSEEKEEEKEVPEIEEAELKSIVVKELPVQQVNIGLTEDGGKVNLISVEDALTEIYQDIKLIKKAVA